MIKFVYLCSENKAVTMPETIHKTLKILSEPGKDTEQISLTFSDGMKQINTKNQDRQDLRRKFLAGIKAIDEYEVWAGIIKKSSNLVASS